MKKIKLIDSYGSKSVRMCEKHFKVYKLYLDRAQDGGTSYKTSRTTEGDCDICLKSR